MSHDTSSVSQVALTSLEQNPRNYDMRTAVSRDQFPRVLVCSDINRERELSVSHLTSPSS